MMGNLFFAFACIATLVGCHMTEHDEITTPVSQNNLPELRFSISTLENKLGILYYPTDGKPITGIVEEHYSDGSLFRHTSYTDGIRNGVGKQFFRSGKLFYEVTYRNNLQCGIGRSYYESGTLESETHFDSEGNMLTMKGFQEDGSFGTEVTVTSPVHPAAKDKTDPTEINFPNISVRSSTQFPTYSEDEVKEENRICYLITNNEPVTGIVKSIRKDVELGGPVTLYRSYYKGFEHGKTRVFYLSDKLAFVGMALKGDFASGTVLYESGRIMREFIFRDGKRNGVEKHYYESGQIKMITPYIDDRPDGLELEYYESGKLKAETPHNSGTSHGNAREYYESGKLKSTSHHCLGTLTGPGRDYYESGALQSETPWFWSFSDPVNIRGIQREYYESGQIRVEAPYELGQINGEVKEYYEDGTLKMVEPYYYNDRSGIKEIYYPSGAIHAKIEFKDDKPEGDYFEYFQNGNLKETVPYTNGKTNGFEKEYYESGELKESYVTFDCGKVERS